MTKYDLRIASFILAAVVALGLLLGYGVGYMTRPDTRAVAEVPVMPPAFDASAGTGAKSLKARLCRGIMRFTSTIMPTCWIPGQRGAFVPI